jgi:hypothetical protein
MIRAGICSLATALLALFAGLPQARAQQNATTPPDFKEVYGLVRQHLTGMSEADLDRASVQGLISQLAPRVSLAGPEAATVSSSSPGVTKSNLFDGPIVYVRVARVGEGLAGLVRQAWEQFAGTNKPKGLVLDLRYASGEDYAAATAVAELFLSQERPLLDWGNGMARSKEQQKTVDVPVAAMVNRETAGAAEAVAGILRQTGAGLIIGSRTAGLAMIAHEYPLKNGGHLRIATAPIHLGNGEALPTDGLRPDIAVTVSPNDERAYYADAFKDLIRTNQLSGDGLTVAGTGAGTNRTRRIRFNEAELVRERRDGFNPDAESAAPDDEHEKPVVRDPALARALDLLKGLALVKQSRS